MRWLERSRIARTSRRADDLLRRSLLAALDRDFGRVEELLGVLVRGDSGDIDAYLALGRVYRDGGELGRAIALHQTLVLRGDLDAHQRMDALCELAADFRRGGFARRAIAAYEEVLEHDGRRPDALRAMVGLLVEAGEPDRAWKLLRRLERSEGRVTPRLRAELMCAMAQRAREDGRTKAARRAVRRAIRFDAEDADAHLLSAELEIEDGRVKPALRAWEAALKIAPERAAELLERAAHHLTAKGQATVYETMLRERLARLPDDAPSILALAQLLVHEGRPDEARTLLQGLISREPENVAAHVHLGRILLAASGHDVDPQLAKPYGELLDALDHRVKPEERS